MVGNLGHDGSGHVDAFEFASGPWKGFVKSACDADVVDPSVSHLIVVDSGVSSSYMQHYDWEDVSSDYSWVELSPLNGAQSPGAAIQNDCNSCPSGRRDCCWFHVDDGATETAWANDDGYFVYRLPFAFPWYGEPHATVHISVNGYLTFGTTQYAYGNALHIPTPGGNIGGRSVDSLIGVLWGDLDTTNKVDDAASTVFYGTIQTINSNTGTAMTAAVIQYERVGYCCSSSAPDYGTGGVQHVANPAWGNTYEAILYSNGDVLLQYKEIMQGGSQQPSIGYESHDGTRGDQISFGWQDFTDKVGAGLPNIDPSTPTITPPVAYIINARSGYTPQQTCGFVNQGGVGHGSAFDNLRGAVDTTRAQCQGSSTNLDDHEVSSIGPGSTIMLLVYGVENLNDGGATTNCLTETQHRAIFDVAISCIQEESFRTAGEHCEYEWWASGIDDLIPNRYAFSSTASDTSTDGATNFQVRFGDNWNQYIYHACVTSSGNTVADQGQCEHSNAAGNCIYDGGSKLQYKCHIFPKVSI